MDPQQIENELLGPDAGDNDNEGQDNRGEGGNDTPEVSGGRDFDSEASRKGWVPKEHYRGDPSKWVDAKTFVERGERFNKNLQREVESLKSELASFKGTAAKFAKFHEETVARKNEEIKEAISALRVQRAEALRDGDAQLSVELEDKIDSLKEQQSAVKEEAAAAKQPPQQQRDVVLEEWIEDGNDWFKSEPKLRDYAIRIGTEMRDVEGMAVNGREFLDEVSRRMKRDFPRYFREQRDTSGRRGAVDDGASRDGNSSGSRGGYSERDLPDEDRQLMKEFVAQGIMTKEQYLAGYFSDAPRKHQTKAGK